MSNLQDEDKKNLNIEDNETVSWKPEEVPQLTVDVYRQDNIIFVVSTVAGVNPKDLDISIETNVLSIAYIKIALPQDSLISYTNFISHLF